MRFRPRFGLVGLVVFALWVPGCLSFAYIDGECSVTEDCRTWYNYLGGTECVLDACVCINPKEAVCCPDGGVECPMEEYACRSKLICQGIVSTVKISPGEVCTADEQCLDPVDKRCGPPVCKNGRCAYEAGISKPLPGQYPGDCSIEECNFDGKLEKIDADGDLPIDGNECTYDLCDEGTPHHMMWEDGTPALSFGVCVIGRRFDCMAPLDIYDCPGALVCDVNMCVPAYCVDGMLSPLETDVDCGGPDCRKCDIELACQVGSDCTSEVCELGICQIPTHTDGVKNHFETGADCGVPGPLAFPCKDGEGCFNEKDCLSQVCYNGICQPPNCHDARINGSETDVDCGGSCPPCKKW